MYSDPNYSFADGPRFAKYLPSAPLVGYVSHYWLSLGNPDRTHTVLPDGSVDLVIEVSGAAASAFVYGPATARSDVALDLGHHFLGIAFRPGQSRHFINAAASEIADTRAPAEGLLGFGLDDVPERIGSGAVVSSLNKVLERHIAGRGPARTDIDDIVRMIEARRGAVQINEAAAQWGKSARHLEREFLARVGIGAKLFARIVRFRHAASLAAGSATPLAAIAADCGYADQSHMSHEFRRFANLAPAAYARGDVGFLQDPPGRGAQNESPVQSR